MNMTKKGCKNIDDYSKEYSLSKQRIINKLRKAISSVVPNALETMQYGIPTFTLSGKSLVHFAVFEKHVGFYPTPSAVSAFKEELSTHIHANGSIQFSLDKPIPFDMIKRIVLFRVNEIAIKNKKN